MPRSSSSISWLFACLLLIATDGAAAASVLVDDQAALLTDDQRERITLFHRYLLKDFDIDYRLITTREAGDLVVFGARQFKTRDVGGLSKSGRGLLLVIDAAQDRVRLEVGHALEGIYTDGFVAYIEQRQMVPFFQAQRIADGTLATTELIVQRGQQAIKRNALDVAPGVSGSSGAGATANALIGKPTATPYQDQNRSAFTAGKTPSETLRAYFSAMRSHDSRPQLDLYTSETQILLRKWITTPAQMDNILRTYERCHPHTVKIGPAAVHAVIRYPADQRRCSPWFFVREGGKWRLDLAVMQRAVRFGRDNSWRFGGAIPTSYEFAFRDWKFDRYGFPRRH
jgi:uncharacterized protein